MGLFLDIAFRLGKHIDIFAVYSNRTKVLFCEKKTATDKSVLFLIGLCTSFIQFLFLSVFTDFVVSLI